MHAVSERTGRTIAVGALVAERDAALAAATEWLELMDTGGYAACWSSAAGLMRGVVTKAQLAQALRGALEPMGKLVSRSMSTAEHHETLPGAPDGRYWVISYSASYANKMNAVETVTAMWDSDTWRVSGYYIR